MGAGFDSRWERFGNLFAPDVKWFEVDAPHMIQYKRDALGHPRPGVTPVPVLFGDECWLKKLVEAGFSTHKRTLFLLEGVVR